eukprot:COSAG04_NODE_17170_length_477_cov_0.642857_1_plen_113_part_01
MRDEKFHQRCVWPFCRQFHHSAFAPLAALSLANADLVEEHSHIRALGEAISGSKVQRLGLSNCQLGTAVTAFVQSVSWETAALTEVDVSSNRVDQAACLVLREATNCVVITES